MNEENKIKQLISTYIDGEATPSEQELVEQYIRENAEYSNYYKELRQLNTTLKEWPPEGLSPDLEHKIHTSLKEVKMKSKHNLMKIGGGGFIVIVLVAAVGLQILKQKNNQILEPSPEVAHKQHYEVFFPDQTDNIKEIAQLGDSVSDKEKRELGWEDVAVLDQDSKKARRKSFKSDISQREDEKASNAPLDKNNDLKAEIATGYAFTMDESHRLGLLSKNKKVSEQVPQSLAIHAEIRSTGGKVAEIQASRSAMDSTRTRKIGGFQQSTYIGNIETPAVGGKSIKFYAEHAEGEGVIYEESKTDLYFPRPTTEIRASEPFNTEQYQRIYENQFLEATENPLSTFSIDVDTASYSNVRRFLNNNQMPPADSVRIEEMVNYFSYDYPEPKSNEPFSITTEASIAPWNKEHQLMLIGLQGQVPKELPPSNLVFLIDVSGSMNQPNKLPLLKSAFRMMVNQLTDDERVAIVVYAGAAGTVLESTPGSNKQKILTAIDNLNAGGSTAGGAGIKLAYSIAKENFIEGGNNRIILATDGDFNIGVSNNGDLVRIIEEKREEGVFLTVLGFGMGNYKDDRLEQLANKGNGNYYYIDTQREAKKVLVNELGSTLFTIAKDVKLQIEFNPTQVKAYRLIGYENRIMAKEDFNDDTKDAGELGAGHTVTALYEIVPADSQEEFNNVDDLVYQKKKIIPSNELMTVKLRYKEPDGDTSKLIKKTVNANDLTETPSGDFQFAASVAEFGLILRNSEFKGSANYECALKNAEASKGKDSFGYRSEFIDLINKASQIDTRPDKPGIIFKGEQKLVIVNL